MITKTFMEGDAFAPGKIMFMGEWSVLEPGNPCIVLTTDKGIHVTLEPGLGGLSQKNVFLKNAFFVAVEFFKDCSALQKNLFKLKIESEISEITFLNKTFKPGLGSSAALVVAVIKAVASFCEKKVDDEVIFKLSAIAHFMAQKGAGSCYDIAAATFGGPLFYQRFEQDFFDTYFEKFLSKEISLYEFVHKKWPGLEIKKIFSTGRLNPPWKVIPFSRDMYVCVGFVGRSSDTVSLLKKVEKQKEVLREDFAKISCLVKKIAEQGERMSSKEILFCIRENRKILQSIEKKVNVVLETPELKKLCDIAEKCGGAAKFSGAGGGDCGIAVCFDKNVANQIMCEWKKHNIVPVAHGSVFLPLKLTIF